MCRWEVCEVFVFSVKASKKHLLVSLVCVGLTVVIAAIAFAIPTTGSASGTPVISTKVENGEERVAFLKNLGYEIESEPLEVREIRIPDEPDEALKEYNELQKQMGWDLEPYLGKRVKLYTYRILNDESGAKAHLCVYRDTVIAGHVATADGQRVLVQP